MKKAFTILAGFSFFLGFLPSLIAYETSNRAFLNGPGLHLSVVKITSSKSQWVLSGFAPGVGSFNETIISDDRMTFSYNNGTGKLRATVTNSLGLPVVIEVDWGTPAAATTQTVNIPNPSRVLTINFKRTSVTGTIGIFNLGSLTGVSGGVDQRVVNP